MEQATNNPEKPFIQTFKDSCIEYASLAQEVSRSYQTGGLSKDLPENKRKLDGLFDKTIETTAEKLLSTEPEKRLNFITEIESENRRLKNANEMLRHLFDPNEFIKITLLKALEIKESRSNLSPSK